MFLYIDFSTDRLCGLVVGVPQAMECFNSNNNVNNNNNNNNNNIYLIRGLSPQANYADRATAACRRS
jgi:hypothetical protein